MGAEFTSIERQADFNARVEAYRQERRAAMAARPTARRRKVRRKRPVTGRGLFISALKFPLALAIGAGSMMVGRVALLIYASQEGLPPLDTLGPAVMSGGHIGVALVVTLLLGFVFRMNWPQRVAGLAGLAGVVAMESGQLEIDPALWAQFNSVESAEYVADVILELQHGS